MATEVLMPKLGATMESGRIMKWLKQLGETVDSGDPLVEIMTDKINIEVEADTAGVLTKIIYQEDEEANVGEIIGYIGQEGEVELSTVYSETGLLPQDEPTLHFPKVRRTPAARKLAISRGVNLEDVKGTGPQGRIQRKDVEEFTKKIVKPTPLASKIAKDQNIDVASIKGSGVNGKILRSDVVEKLNELETSLPETERIKVQGIRKIVSQRMAQSAFTAPHVTIMTEVDMSNVIEMRKQLLPGIEKQTNLRLSYTEIIMKTVAKTLRKHPKINASLNGDEIILHSQVNIGLAVSIPDGLLVPVVKTADQKGLAELTKECKRLSGLTRDGKLQPDDMASGTFTISNLGMYAVDTFTPIINQPESAILGVGRIHEKVVGVNGKIELRSMVSLSLAFDHRVIDGAPAAAFLTELKEMLENPYQLLV
ncbi:dihydrolipoamide acetyltransferase family protein [Bacillus sp. JJ1503]|uniref:dihydrolipoamide acetyltransferase family protein n=1 Tax=Bacillus sp. JJ1503 TaxID=3122956 RepID=UPI002FFEAC41